MSLSKLFENNIPKAVGKIGSSECRALYSMMKGQPMTPADYHDIFVGAGVFPPTVESLEEFGQVFEDSLKSMDVMAKWLLADGKESFILDSFCKDSRKVILRDLEPYYWDDPWSQFLKDKTVLVISPFTSTIETQYKKRERLWKDDRILPSFNLKTIRCPLSWYLGEKKELTSWSKQLDMLKSEMDKVSFDVCLIGAGAWSLPLAVHAKRTGHVGIHMGGSLQILFGIRGKRWDDHEVISKFYNKDWVRPSESEKPKSCFMVENGCYW